MKQAWNDEMMYEFCSNMAMVLEGGLSPQDCLEVIVDHVDEQQKKENLLELLEEVKDKGSLYESVKEKVYVDSYAIQMIKIGEMSGNLDGVMEALAKYYERQSQLKQNLKDALIYPCILLMMMWCIVLLIIWKILPIFEKVFEQMGMILTNGSQAMMQFGKLFAIGSFAVLTIILLGGILCYIMNRATQCQWLSKFVFTKRLYYDITMAKMTYAFSLFVSSGYDAQEALMYLPGVIDHPKMLKKLEQCNKDLKEISFVEAIQKEALYEGVYATMLYTGFHSGKAEEVLKKLSVCYERDVDQSITTFLNTIEPAIVILLSVIVGVILLSVMLPLMSIMTSI